MILFFMNSLKFNYICYLHHNKLLTHNEFKTFEYLLTRSLSNRHLQDYLYNLYRFSEKVKEEGSTNIFLYADLLEYGFGKGLFSRAAFSDPKAWLDPNLQLHHYLNF